MDLSRSTDIVSTSLPSAYSLLLCELFKLKHHKKSIKGKLTLSNFLLPVLQLFRTVTDVGTQNCVETLMLGKQKPLVKQPGDWPGGFL